MQTSIVYALQLYYHMRKLLTVENKQPFLGTYSTRVANDALVRFVAARRGSTWQFGTDEAFSAVPSMMPSRRQSTFRPSQAGEEGGTDGGTDGGEARPRTETVRMATKPPEPPLR